MPDLKFIIEECRLSFIFKSVEPLPESELLSWLVTEGFAEIKDIPRKIGTPTFGIERMNIARKGANEVLYDNLGGLLGVTGKKIEDVMEGFDIVGSILKKNGVDLPSNVKSLELALSLRIFVKGVHKPLEKIGKFLGINRFSGFSKIMEEEVIPFDVRFCPRREAKTSENLKTIANWFDIHIYPYVYNPNYFEVRVVFRDSSFEKVIEFTKTVMDKMASIISIILEGK